MNYFLTLLQNNNTKADRNLLKPVKIRTRLSISLQIVFWQKNLR
jgi:hypothetical protein